MSTAYQRRVAQMIHKLGYNLGIRTEDELVREMVDRFLSWRLPDDFHPDCGISFVAPDKPHPDALYTPCPVGTNLLTAPQAEVMIRHMLGLKPAAVRGDE